MWKKEKEAQKERNSHSQHATKLAPGPTSLHTRSLALSQIYSDVEKSRKLLFLG